MMPIIEYVCEGCGDIGETINILAVTTPPETKECQRCGGIMHRTVSLPSIRFKGKGWTNSDRAARDNLNPDKHTKLYIT